MTNGIEIDPVDRPLRPVRVVGLLLLIGVMVGIMLSLGCSRGRELRVLYRPVPALADAPVVCGHPQFLPSPQGAPVPPPPSVPAPVPVPVAVATEVDRIVDQEGKVVTTLEGGWTSALDPSSGRAWTKAPVAK